jgi:hypothetical protein
MHEIEFELPESAVLNGTEQVIESICFQMSLTVSMKGSLSKHPGCTHWHFKSGTRGGTLELTFCAAKRRLWATIQSGRKADWIDDVLPILRSNIEAELRTNLHTDGE